MKDLVVERNNGAGGEQRTENDASLLYAKLLGYFQPAERVIVAFSGGVDSSLVLQAAVEALGADHVLGITASSASLAESELKQARRTAAEIGARHRIIESCELANPDYRRNGPDRCYHCKSELYTMLERIRRSENYDRILNGTNHDDQGDFRPGNRAAIEFGVGSPLQQLGFSKTDIRRTAAFVGLGVDSKPAAPCLASRIPYNEPVSEEKLQMIEKAENYLHSIGIVDCRVRHHGTVARIELNGEDFPRLASEGIRAGINRQLRAIGFLFVTIDLAEFQSGGLNRLLPEQSRQSTPSRS